MIQGGDFTKRNGMGGESIYGSPFADEDLTRPLDAKGLLCMANKGPNTNGSQFFVTLRDCPHLNGKHVVFGRVIRGYDEVVGKISEVETDEKDRPLIPISIVNCGELVLKAKVEKQEEAKVKESADESANSDHEKSKKRRHRHRSRSPASEASEEEDRTRHKKHRSKKSKSKRSKDKVRSVSPSTEAKEGEEETEEQYDARLEREENERIEAARRKELERIKRNADNIVSKDGVRFKGRGRMTYIDPELQRFATAEPSLSTTVTKRAGLYPPPFTWDINPFKSELIQVVLNDLRKDRPSGDIGAPTYRAPEILIRAECGKEIDSWAVGCLFKRRFAFDQKPSKDYQHAMFLEYVQGKTAFNTFGDANSISRKVRLHVKKAMDVLPAAGFVHGDIRRPNVLVVRRHGLDDDPADSDGGMLLDFDWAGREGEVRYPYGINMQINWTDGVAGGKPILKEHDRNMYRVSTGSSTPEPSRCNLE
ncbi:hypothetical protein EUX98_g5954 [Antrodiella citrinella]|uniref:peptidylprolyl isomerase n=1 Tax=Antrodiella citrinella TaxID=2447956 RepID=A0A4S4MXW2_9APHY|nr:hypothetical protein EUX98_g5954 [Antrodiella citrinella]